MRFYKITIFLACFVDLVGGIYTVIRSKAYVSTEEMGDNYCLFGPYKEQCARQEVELGDLALDNPLQIAANKLRETGFDVRQEIDIA